jgi:plasmid stabilization system protein ParE
MMLIVRFLPEAATELDDAVNFYNTLKDGLGIDFAAEVRDGLARITQYPKAWQLLGRRVRRYRLHRFPYGLVYAQLPSEILVVAVMHLHQKPNYWLARLK